MNRKLTLMQQPCGLSCLPTCVAMITGQPLDLIMQHFPRLPAYEMDAMKCLVRFGYLPIERFSHPILEGGLYIITVPSLQSPGVLHAVVADTRTPGQVKVLDPWAGREGPIYTADQPLPSCGAIEILHAYEVDK